MLYNLINPIFQHLSLTSTAAVSSPLSLSSHSLPPHLSLSIIVSCLRFSHSLSHCFSTFFAGTLRLCSPFFFFFWFCVCYFAWCLVFGWWENVGKQREIYIFLFWYDLWIYTWFWVFFLVLGVWLLRKCGKAKGNSLFFPLWSIWFLRNWKKSKVGWTELIEIQLVWCRCQIWSNRKFWFSGKIALQTDWTATITPLLQIIVWTTWLFFEKKYDK